MTVRWPDILIADPGLAIWRSSIVSANGVRIIITVTFWSGACLLTPLGG